MRCGMSFIPLGTASSGPLREALERGTDARARSGYCGGGVVLRGWLAAGRLDTLVSEIWFPLSYCVSVCS
jgi:hypothetical protein